jgi:hypothetical protein
LYLGGEAYFKALDEAMKEKPFRPVLITGQSGGGKSALVANWVAQWSRKHPKAAVIVHHLGCGSDAAHPVQMAARLMREISRLTGDEFKPESDPEKLLELLPQWLALASAWAQRSKRELLIVLDGLDEVTDSQDLNWLSNFAFADLKIVLTADAPTFLTKTKTVDFAELVELSTDESSSICEDLFKDPVHIPIEPLTLPQKRELIGSYLARYHKTLTAKLGKILQSHPLSGNPLFLLTVLEELRVFGVHEEIEQRMRTLLSPAPSKGKNEAPTVDDAFEHVLARLEDDISAQGVQRAMEVIWASREGVRPHELFSMSGVVPAQWAAIENTTYESLNEIQGKIRFNNGHLRRAVEDRYGIRDQYRLSLHWKMAQWYMLQTRTSEVLQDLVWQLQQAKMVKELVRIPELMETLSPQEREVLIDRFGVVTGESQSLVETSRLTGIDPIRVRKIEVKALRKLMHPTRLATLSQLSL